MGVSIFRGLGVITCGALLAGPSVNAYPAPELFPRQAGIVSPNLTIVIDPAYPVYTGYPGPTKAGQAPLLAETDGITTLLPKTGASVELRYASSDHLVDFSVPISRRWGNTSPYFPSPLFPEAQIYRQLDKECTIDSVHILHRHGARYPTSSSTEGAPFFAQTVTNASAANNLSVSGPLAFLANWTYNLGSELMVPLGTQEVYSSGVKHYYDYGKLYVNTSKPVIRTTSQQRMLDSALYWSAGFFGLNAPNMIDLQVIIEGDGFNNTLAPYDTCKNANNISVGNLYLATVWTDIYLNTTVARLQKHITSGITLTPKLVSGMQALCAYETVGLGYSPFCELFTDEEWQGFEYLIDLKLQGNGGIMNPSGRAQGIGWVQEFLARLQDTAIAAADVTTQNTTLTAPALYDQRIFVDFTHDNVFYSVLAAMNITQVVGEVLSPTHMDPDRNLVVSHITPFGARLVMEVASCGAGKGEQIIRMILNDALIPLGKDQGCTGYINGTCALTDFLQFQNAHALKDANFNKACFGKNGTDFTVSGATITNGTVP